MSIGFSRVITLEKPIDLLFHYGIITTWQAIMQTIKTNLSNLGKKFMKNVTSKSLAMFAVVAAAATAAKAPNYSAEMTAAMVADYKAGITPEVIGEKLGRSVRSVVAKLSREGVYKPKTYTTKTGEAVVKKDECADKIATILNLSVADADSLTKANKSALKAILSALELQNSEAVDGEAVAG